MAHPLTNSFSQSNSCQNCPSGQFTYEENDETSCFTSKALPNGNGYATNVGHNLRHIVLEWVAGRTSVIIEQYGHISDWNVSHITNMKNLFYNTPAIVDDISKWQTDSVITMESMFQSNSVFNSNISAWNTGVVTNMAYSKSFIDQCCFCGNCFVCGWSC
jgi:surface protein